MKLVEGERPNYIVVFGYHGKNWMTKRVYDTLDQAQAAATNHTEIRPDGFARIFDAELELVEKVD